MSLLRKFLASGLLLLTISVSSYAQSASIIGKSVKIGKLEIAQFDFPAKMIWKDAAAACTALGKGWRLPTKPELQLIYLNRAKIGGFAKDYYWSSSTSEYYDSSGSYFLKNMWFQNFDNGVSYDGDSDGYAFHVRAVKTI